MMLNDCFTSTKLFLEIFRYSLVLFHHRTAIAMLLTGLIFTLNKYASQLFIQFGRIKVTKKWIRILPLKIWKEKIALLGTRRYLCVCIVWEVKMWRMKWRKNQSRKNIIHNTQPTSDTMSQEKRKERLFESVKLYKSVEKKREYNIDEILCSTLIFSLHTYYLQFKLESEPTSFLPWLLANNLQYFTEWT
jgi:hypothetical protein